MSAPLGAVYDLLLEAESVAVQHAYAGEPARAIEILAVIDRVAELPRPTLARRAVQAGEIVRMALGRNRTPRREAVHAL